MDNHSSNFLSKDEISTFDNLSEGDKDELLDLFVKIYSKLTILEEPSDLYYLKKPRLKHSTRLCKLIDTLCTPTTLYFLFEFKFYIALMNEMISFTNDKFQCNHSEINTGRYFMCGVMVDDLDFTNHEHPDLINLLTLLIKVNLLVLYEKLCHIINRHIIHIICVQNKLQNFDSYLELSEDWKTQLTSKEGLIPPILKTRIRSFHSVEYLSYSLLKYHIHYNNFKIAITKKNLDELELLIKHSENIDPTDHNGISPLMYAATFGYTTCLIKLIESGANVDATNSVYINALMLATHNGHIQCAEILIRVGAHVNSEGRYGWNALHFAADLGQVALVDLLVENGVDINLKSDSGLSPIIVAADYGYTKCIEKLIEYGAQVNCADSKFVTALMSAAIRGHTDCVNSLLKYGAEVDLKDRTGRTALMLSAITGSLPVVMKLIEAGSDIFIKDNINNTALTLAQFNDKKDIVSYLTQQQGAKKKPLSIKN